VKVESASSRVAKSANKVGMVEFTGLLNVHLIGAKKLTAKDANGTSDPYAILTLNNQTLKSKVVKKSLSPYFGEKLTLCVTDASNDVLKIQLFDHDLIGKDEVLGHCEVALKDLKPNVNDLKLTLVRKSGKPKGELFIQLEITKLT